MTTITMKAPSAIVPGTQVFLRDGSSVTVDSDSLIEISSQFINDCLAIGFELTTASVGGTPLNAPSTVVERDSLGSFATQDVDLTLLGGLNVINKTGLSIAAGKLVAVTTLDATSGAPKIVLADADVAAHDNVYVTTAAIADGATGRVYKGALSAADINTNSITTAGDAVYLDTTAGGFAVTAPTGATARQLVVGYVVVKSATVGQILWNVGPVRKIDGGMIQAQTIDGGLSKNLGDASVLGGIPVLFRIDIAAGALASKDTVLTNKMRIIDAFLILRGAGVSTTTLTVLNSASAITNAMAASGSDQALVRATTIDDAAWEIAAGGTLRVQSLTGASQPAATVYVWAIPVA